MASLLSHCTRPQQRSVCLTSKAFINNTPTSPSWCIRVPTVNNAKPIHPLHLRQKYRNISYFHRNCSFVINKINKESSRDIQLRKLRNSNPWHRLIYARLSSSSDQNPSQSQDSDATTPPSTSTSTSNAAVDASGTATIDGTAERPALKAECLRPRALFPWRHSPHPLPRLIKPRVVTRGGNNSEYSASEGGDGGDGRIPMSVAEALNTEYYTKGGLLGPGWPAPMDPMFRGAMFAVSMERLDVPYLTIILPWSRKRWVADMEYSFCDAFASGVHGMIEDTYCWDADIGERSDPDSYCVDVNITVNPIPSSKDGEDTKSSDEADLNNLGKNSEPKSHDESGRDQEQYKMLEKKFRQLYQSAREHSHPSKMNIVLKMDPYDAQIESMFPVLGLSRKLVEEHPALRHSYRNLVRHIQRKNKEAHLEGKQRLGMADFMKYMYEGLGEIIEHSAKLSDDGKAVTTVVAQVSIHCREIFCVRDVETGAILQGEESESNVSHLVRFEMVVKETGNGGIEPGEIELGRWQITDWDDLLEGNVWFA